jgi:hypothetical protein
MWLQEQPVLQAALLLLLAALLLLTVLTPHAPRHLESLAVHVLLEVTQQAARHCCQLC